MMKIDLCKLFGVEEGEEFKFSCFNDIFCFKNNELFEVQKINDVDKQYMLSLLPFNTVVDLDIIKLPKKKQFSNDELCVLRNIDKKYKWIARDRSGNICIFEVSKAKVSPLLHVNLQHILSTVQTHMNRCILFFQLFHLQ